VPRAGAAGATVRPRFNPSGETTAHDHVGFGHGLHVCLGTLLVQTEVTSVIRLMSDRFPNCALTEDIERTPRATSPISNAFARLHADLSP
jgi:cytochrome P450